MHFVVQYIFFGDRAGRGSDGHLDHHGYHDGTVWFSYGVLYLHCTEANSASYWSKATWPWGKAAKTETKSVLSQLSWKAWP
jgi:hypothetical protein